MIWHSSDREGEYVRRRAKMKVLHGDNSAAALKAESVLDKVPFEVAASGICWISIYHKAWMYGNWGFRSSLANSLCFIRDKIKPKKKPLNLIWNCIWYYIFARNLIFGEKKIQSALDICISMDSIKGWKIFGEKNSMKFQKTQLEFATHLQLFT